MKRKSEYGTSRASWNAEEPGKIPVGVPLDRVRSLVRDPRLRELRIGVLMGGESPEREISISTGEAVCGCLARSDFRAESFDLTRATVSRLVADPPDVAFVALHGGLGEDGSTQGLLEWLDVPYTGAGVLGSALAMDKLSSKRIFERLGIPTPSYEAWNRSEVDEAQSYYAAETAARVVKPTGSGSSVGLTVVREPRWIRPALEEAFSQEQTVLVEEYLEGRELTVGFVEETALPVVEIRPKSGLYDYSSKYTPGLTDYLVPAPLPSDVAAEAQLQARRAFDALRVRDLGRVDMVYEEHSGRMNVLEVNSIPGMTETSLLPKAAAAVGVSFLELVLWMIDACLRREGRASRP